MANNVNFYKGTQAQYDALTKDAYTFYLVEGTNSNDLYIGSVKLSNASDLAAAITRIATNEEDIDDIQATLTTLQGADTVDGSIAKMIKDASDIITAQIGDLTTLSTTTKSDIVSAMNELYEDIEAGGSGSVVTIDTSTTTSGMSKSYTIKQGTKTVGVIDIPKDMVVSSAEVVTNPEGQAAGTYIKMVIANSEDVLYINVGTLVDIYTAETNATQVQLTIDQSTNTISAAIVAKSIGTTELADSAVTTVKIADGNVTKAKLAAAVQTSLDLADSALQAANITTGTSNGTISVDGTDVSVKGLGSAAYTASGDYDAAGSANTALTSAKSYTDTSIAALDVTDTAVSGSYVSAVSETNGKISVTRATLPDYSDTYDAKGAADTALASAKEYTDTALTWQSLS